MKTTIGRKIGLAFLALLILIVMMVVITFHGFNTITNSLNNMEHEAVKRGASGNLRFSITQLLMAGNDYIITEKDYYKREYNRWNLNVDDFYKQFIQLHLTDDELRLTEEIKQDIDSIRAISAKIFSIQHPRQSPEAWVLMEMMDYRFGEDVNMKTTQIFDGISRRVEEHRIQASADKESVANTMYIVTFFVVFISFLVSYLTIQRISKPIIIVTKAANGIANGDYSQRPNVKTHDEIAVLAESFSSMAESIQKSQKALEESKRLTEAIVATVPVGLMVYDSNGKILSVNNGFCNFFGLFQNLPLYQNIKSLFNELTVTEECRNHILSCKPVQNVECCLSDAKKGTRIFNLTILPLKLTDSESLLVLQDITDQKKAEEELLKIGTAVEQTADCVVITDKNGIIQYINRAFTKIFGYSKEEAIGKTPRILKSGLHPPEFYEGLWKTILSGEVFNETFINKRKDGELIYEIKTITPIKDKEGNITHFVSTAKEITEQKRAEAELAEREKRYRALFNLSPSGIVLEDIKGNIFEVNEAYCKSIGYSKEELIGRNVRMVASPEQIPHIEDHIALLRSGKTLQHVIENIKKDGTRCWVELHETLILLPDGREGFLVVANDISERRLAEEELLKIGTAVEQTADCVVITDKNGIIQYINRAFTKIFGYSKEEALGKTPRILKSWLHPPEFYEELWKTILSGKIFSKTFINKRKDGELIYEIKTITPIKDKEGNITYFVSTAKEITEQKRAEQEIISQKNKFAQLFENSPIAIALLDDQDKIVLINESFSALFGYYLEEIKGKSVTNFIVPHELKEEAEYFSDQTCGGSQINKESYRKKKDGTLVFVNVIGIPIIINEKLVGIYGMYVDLTQRKEAEEKMRIAKELAEKSDMLKTEFLAQMSHEIRTPINIMVGHVDYLKDLYSEKMDTEASECFEGIDLASKRIIRTIDLILNVAVLQTSGYKPLLKQIDLHSEILNKLFQEHQLSAKQKGLELIYKCELTATKTLADEYSITQIFANLIDNAIKYTKKGRVEVLLGKNKAGNIMVEIKDTGIGMSQEFLSKIFEPFVQEDHGFSRIYDGTGLGLVLTKKYCYINNAVIEVESKKNEGSTFRVIFK